LGCALAAAAALTSSPPVAAAPPQGAGATQATPDGDAGEVEAPAAAEVPTAASTGDDPPAEIGEPEVLDATLPCGLRVLVAQDSSLPVAAVVLAIETGTAADPEELPGLHHALAYQLQQGNRELRPNAILDEVHAKGGLATMAVGSAQVRFESLVPAVHLDRVVGLELSRLRVPSVDERRWRQSVGRARSDRAPGTPVPGDAIAAVWDDPALAREGRRPGKSLRELDLTRLADLLAKEFHYARATLTVVSPEPPAAVLERITARAADLPARPRDVKPNATVPPDATAGAGQPRSLAVKGGKGQTFVWAVPGETETIFSARVVCGVLNRQKPAPNEESKVRVRCVMHEDPRRPVMSVRINGASDPAAELAARLERVRTASTKTTGDAALGDEDTAKLLIEQRQRQAKAVTRASSSPLGLARLLSFTTPRGPAQGVTRRPLRTLSGAASLADPNVVERAVPQLLSLDAAVVLVEPGHDEATSAPPAKPPVEDSGGPLDEDEPDPDVADGQEGVH